MPRPQFHEDTLAPAVLRGNARTRYLVVRQDDLWIIKFEGEEFGPYQTEREALLFAVDAAYKLGQQDDPTEVLLMDENGELKPAWSYGHDPYPPAL